jgi:hypothetical protein
MDHHGGHHPDEASSEWCEHVSQYRTIWVASSLGEANHILNKDSPPTRNTTNSYGPLLQPASDTDIDSSQAPPRWIRHVAGDFNARAVRPWKGQFWFVDRTLIPRDLKTYVGTSLCEREQFTIANTWFQLDPAVGLWHPPPRSRPPRASTHMPQTTL